jgi:2-polyprenyl-3-methyl-5-hydroxy-6-metoxy-1,4-benzoquinol methylase
MSTEDLNSRPADADRVSRALEPSKPLAWDAASKDYLAHRPGYPASFFAFLQAASIGLPHQDILDLGAGTGALSIPFARQGARVTATDISEGQIDAARQSAKQNNVNVTFKVAPSEETGFPDHSFDVITASMSWGYFKLDKMLVEVPRLLKRPGRLVLSSLVWIRHADPVAIHSENLILKYNPAAALSFNRSDAEIVPSWAKNHFRLTTYHRFVHALPFTRTSWAGRLRASRFILAALPKEEAAAFDAEHQQLLKERAPEHFEIAHQIRVQILEPLA